MRYMDSTDRQILQRLVQIAGSPLLVEQALRELNRRGEIPSMEDVLRYILDRREAWHAERAAALQNSGREFAPL
jgi:hypothetical protein